MFQEARLRWESFQISSIAMQERFLVTQKFTDDCAPVHHRRLGDPRNVLDQGEQDAVRGAQGQFS